MRLTFQETDDHQELVDVTLSRRNLQTLLHKLDQPDSQRTLVKIEDEGILVVRAEDNQEHYGVRPEPPGPVHPVTEAHLAWLARQPALAKGGRVDLGPLGPRTVKEMDEAQTVAVAVAEVVAKRAESIAQEGAESSDTCETPEACAAAHGDAFDDGLEILEAMAADIGCELGGDGEGWDAPTDPTDYS